MISYITPLHYNTGAAHSFYVTDASRKLAENRRAEVRFQMVMTHECYSTIHNNIWVGTIGIQQQYYTYVSERRVTTWQRLSGIH